MIEMFLNIQTLMILAISILFTAVGWFWGQKSGIEKIVASTVDSLIADGYLKTTGTGKDLVIIKWQQWNDK